MEPDARRPSLLTFDIFGTVVDWRRGLVEALAANGRADGDALFDRIVDHQGADEKAGWRLYADITARSLVDVANVTPARAAKVGADVGKWPLYPDSRQALARLRKIAPCVAMTNSDRAHGEDVQRALGFRMDRWICAEEVRTYKPSASFWDAVEQRLGRTAGPDWWHVSAYADYDLKAANARGLTTVFVRRPHSRPGPATLSVADLADLADRF